MNDSLVAYYPFNGNANDESGNGNDGTVSGATLTEDRFGNANSAYHFDGIDDFIEIVEPINIPYHESSRSISAWVLMEDGTDSVIDRVIVGYGSQKAQSMFGLQYGLGDSYDYGIWIYDCRYDLDCNGGYANFVEKRYYHLVAIYNEVNEKLQLFIDGILYKGTIISIDTTKTNIYIGYQNNPNVGWFNGIIDDIRIYNRALSESEIQQLYNSNDTPKDCFTQADIDDAVNTAVQACVNDPSSCGISTNSGYTQADLDTKYQDGYNAGCTACSDGTALPATISPELKMHIPVLQYVSPFGAMDLWADFEFAGESNGDMLWKLSDFRQN